MPERLVRNKSHAGLTRNTSKVVLKRNLSTQGVSSRPGEKSGRRTSSSWKERAKVGRQQATVHFDLGDDDGHDEESWTEVSNSESPTITRPPSQAASHTEDSPEVIERERPIVQSAKAGPDSSSESASGSPASSESRPYSRDGSLSVDGPHPQPRAASQAETDDNIPDSLAVPSTPSSKTQSTPRHHLPIPTAELAPSQYDSPSSDIRHLVSTPSKKRTTSPGALSITERILLRNDRHQAAPQMSTVSAIGTPKHSQNSQSHSPSSPIAPSSKVIRENVISRFLPSSKTANHLISNASPRTNSMEGSISPAGITIDPPSRDREQSGTGEDLARAKSTTHLTHQPSRNATRNEGRSEGLDLSALALPSKKAGQSNRSRVEQKMWLQRASSNVENDPLGPTLGSIGGGSRGKGGDHINDLRASRLCNRANVEYNAVRRYRDPLADSIHRVRQVQSRMGKSTKGRQTAVGLDKGRTMLTTTTAKTKPTPTTPTMRTKAGKSNVAGSTPEHLEGQNQEVAFGRVEDDIHQILRRIWESQGPEDVNVSGD